MGEDGYSTVRIKEMDGATLALLVRYGRQALGDSALDEWLLPVVARHGWLFVGYDREAVVGAAEVIRSCRDELLYLEGFYIRPRYQGLGYGRRLLADTLTLLAGAGFSVIEATLDPDNAAAGSLYAGAGFNQVGSLPDCYGRGRDRLLLRAEFGGSARG